MPSFQENLHLVQAHAGEGRWFTLSKTLRKTESLNVEHQGRKDNGDRQDRVVHLALDLRCGAIRHGSVLVVVDRNRVDDYFTFACAFRLSAQYFFIRAETSFRAAADIVRVRLRA